MPKTPRQKTRPFDVATLYSIQRLGAPALSPDGRQAVCTLTTPSLAENSSDNSLWLFSTDHENRAAKPRRLTNVGGKDGQPAWSPRGEQIAFVARREVAGKKDATPQLYLIAPDGGEARRVSDFGPGVSSFKWLPDGKRIVFAAWVWPGLKGAAAQNKEHKAFSERKESGYATSQAYYRFWDHNVPMGRVLHLLLLDISSGRITDLFEGTRLELAREEGGNDAYDVHPSGQRLAFAHDPADEQVLANRCVLSELDLKTRKLRTLADDAAWDFSAPRYSPDGRRLAASAANVGRKHTALPQPVLIDAPMRWRAIGANWDLAADAPLRWSADSRTLYFAAELRGRRHLWRADPEAERCSIAHEGGWVQGFDVAGTTLAVVADSALHPARLFARQGEAAPRRLERFNDALLKTVALGEVREVTYTGAQGEPVQMWLTFPAGFDARRKHPLLHTIHGGPFSASGDTFSVRYNAHVFAAAGYVVAQVNYHGSSGFGFAFRDSLIGRQGELELQDIESATDWLLQQRWADAKRVFASGGSYGGFLVAWMNGHVPAGRYRAYVCHAGMFDRIATFSADSWPLRPKDLAANYWQDMPRVLAQSPHAFAGRMQTPTLVTHGALDYRVPDCNGLAYYNTLKARGVDARLLWFPDENHWVLKPRNSQQWYGEFLGWLARHSGRATRSSA